MFVNLIIVTILVLLSGSFAGLTLALFSIQLTTLERKVRLRDKQATKVYKIRKHGNLLLCTLLLGNVVSYIVMAIFLAEITNGVIGGFIATALIFVFGEIIPQAVFPRFAMKISARFSWLIWILLVLFYPVAAPIAWLLDKILGKEPPVLWSKRELEEIIKYHEDVGDGIIDEDEERIILGALTFSDLFVSDIMIPINDVFYLEKDTVISKQVLKLIIQKGFSRIPIVDPSTKKVTGILYSKDLIGFKASRFITVESMSERNKIILVREDTSLDNLLNILVQRNTHLAIIYDAKNQFCGVVTLEDIFEEIMKTELEDIRNKQSSM